MAEKIFPTIAFLFVVLITVFSLWLSIYLLPDLLLTVNSNKTEGIVTSAVPFVTQSCGYKTGCDWLHETHLTIKFKDSKGKTYIVKDDTMKYFMNISPGDKIPLIYFKRNPELATTDTYWELLFSSIIELSSLGLGLTLLIIFIKWLIKSLKRLKRQIKKNNKKNKH